MIGNSKKCVYVCYRIVIARICTIYGYFVFSNGFGIGNTDAERRLNEKGIFSDKSFYPISILGERKILCHRPIICCNRNVFLFNCKLYARVSDSIIIIVQSANTNKIFTNVLALCSCERTLKGVAVYKTGGNVGKLRISIAVGLGLCLCGDVNYLLLYRKLAGYKGYFIVTSGNARGSDCVLTHVAVLLVSVGIGNISYYYAFGVATNKSCIGNAIIRRGITVRYGMILCSYRKRSLIDSKARACRLAAYGNRNGVLARIDTSACAAVLNIGNSRAFDCSDNRRATCSDGAINEVSGRVQGKGCDFSATITAERGNGIFICRILPLTVRLRMRSAADCADKVMGFAVLICSIGMLAVRVVASDIEILGNASAIVVDKRDVRFGPAEINVILKCNGVVNAFCKSLTVIVLYNDGGSDRATGIEILAAYGNGTSI